MSAKDTPAPQAAEPGRAQPVEVPGGGHWWRRLLAFAGPGYLVAVGYMDPGNWATDVAGGAQLGYLLLSVILLSSLMAMLLQALSARLGIASGLDLAQACRERYSPSTCRLLWLACETAIIACDLAEVIGTAIALKLLFGLPLAWGALLCVGDALLVLVLIGRGQRPLEAFVVALLTLIFACFAVQLLLSRPELGEVLQGFLPSPRVLSDPAALYLAIGIVGATVMPHNLYLHSSLVQSRAYPRSLAGKRQASGQQRRREGWEQVGVLPHVEVGRGHAEGQDEQPARRQPAPCRHQQGGGAEQFEDPADPHRRQRPGHVGRDDADEEIGEDEVAQPTQQEPGGHEGQEQRASGRRHG